MPEQSPVQHMTPPTEGEPCPTPLAASEVLREFRVESDAWSIEHNGATIRGRTIGRGTPLILLNGIGGTHELYALFAWLLRDEFRCVLFDYPDDPGRRTVGDFASDLFAVASAQAGDRFAMYATSFGSLVALQAMLRSPERTSRAILQGGFAHRGLSLAERGLVRLGRFLSGNVARLPLRAAVQANNHRPWFPPFDETRWNLFLENTGAVGVQAIARRAAALRDTDLRAALPQIAQRVLLVRSEGEGLVSTRSIDELAAGLPNARSEWMHTSGHLPYLTHPHRLAKLVRDFLSESASQHQPEA
jgi:pimeloyl-ACP methyl ester carboxylesterase